MTFVTRQVTLGTAATEVVGNDNMPHDVILHNMTKSSNQYIFCHNTLKRDRIHLSTLLFLLGFDNKICQLECHEKCCFES